MTGTWAVALLLGAVILQDIRKRQAVYPSDARFCRVLMLVGSVAVWGTGVILTLPPPDAWVAPTSLPGGVEVVTPEDPRLGRLLPLARAWVGEGFFEAVPGTAERPAHIRLAEGWIVSSAGYADDVSGFGGGMELGIWLEEGGVLRAIRILDHNETPWYVERVQGWMDGLVGKSFFSDAPAGEIEIVTGATMTSDAVLRILRRTAQAVEAEGREAGVAVQSPDRAAEPVLSGVGVSLTLLVGGVGAFLLRRKPGVWRRRVWLLGVVLVAGVWWNRQYALVHVGMLLEGGMIGARPLPLVVFLLGMPLLVLLLGNVHCGWLCPFGALQELVGDVSPFARRWGSVHWIWQTVRMLKYVGLLAVVVFGVWLGWAGIFGYDILVTAFAYPPAGVAFGVAGVVVGVSGVYPRFWCRVCCPTGAWFALLGRVRMLRRWIPVPWVRHCDLGIGDAKDVDCLCCDRCRRG